MKRKRRIQWYYSVILLAFGLTACQVKRPDTVISDAKMENVLYDFHIAKAMGEEVPYSESYKRVLLNRFTGNTALPRPTSILPWCGMPAIRMPLQKSTKK